MGGSSVLREGRDRGTQMLPTQSSSNFPGLTDFDGRPFPQGGDDSQSECAVEERTSERLRQMA